MVRRSLGDPDFFGCPLPLAPGLQFLTLRQQTPGTVAPGLFVDKFIKILVTLS